MGHDRFATHRFETVDLGNLPALGFGVGGSALMVVLGALAPHLILS
jgi:hypothetical protein